jgi:hypothetical protein
VFISTHASSAVVQICCSLTGALVATGVGHISLAPVLCSAVGQCAGRACVASGGCSGADFAIRVWDISALSVNFDDRLRRILGGVASSFEAVQVPCIGVMTGHSSRILGISWLPAAHALMSWSGEGLMIWDAVSAQHRCACCEDVEMGKCDAVCVRAEWRIQLVALLDANEARQPICISHQRGHPASCFRVRESNYRLLDAPLQMFLFPRCIAWLHRVACGSMRYATQRLSTCMHWPNDTYVVCCRTRAARRLCSHRRAPPCCVMQRQAGLCSRLSAAAIMRSTVLR